jgi:hypothetical protein
MKKSWFLFLFSILVFGHTKAQTQKTGVLVVGNGNAAAAAAIQSAVSGAKTTLLLQAGGFDISPVGNDLNSGVQATFLQKIREAKGIKDSLQAVTFDKLLANEVMTKWTDSLKNLTIIKTVNWVKAEGFSGGWALKLSNGATVKSKVLINPSDEKLNATLKINQPFASATLLDYANTIYRTSIASGIEKNNTTATVFSMYDLLLPNVENFVSINNAQSMLLGQAAGATAAYAAFFETKTSLSNLKKIQGELINYKLNLMPFTDIKLSDTNWKAIQFVGLTGVLKAEITPKGALFNPEKGVTTEEIKQPFKDYFYKAQIWFDDNKSEQMTISSAIDLICYVGQKDEPTVKKQLVKNWKTNYQFKTEFDLNKPITRRELAVILQEYAPPFNVYIDKNGKIIR